MIYFDTQNRRLWAPLLQEFFLIYYFIVFSKYQENTENEFRGALFNMMYLLGLGVSVFGFLFDFVDENKRKWIPKEAWPNH
jgi:hypothetical protein